MNDPHLLQPDHAPTPFTAAEILEGCPQGRTVTTRTTSAGEPDSVSVSRFVSCDEEGALFESGGRRHRVTWLDLQGHASFPAAATTIAHEVIDVPLGRVDCLRYTVDGGEEVHTFWFAKDLPGMPVRHTTERDGALISTSTVISNDINP